MMKLVAKCKRGNRKMSMRGMAIAVILGVVFWSVAFAQGQQCDPSTPKLTWQTTSTYIDHFVDKLGNPMYESKADNICTDNIPKRDNNVRTANFPMYHPVTRQKASLLTYYRERLCVREKKAGNKIRKRRHIGPWKEYSTPEGTLTPAESHESWTTQKSTEQEGKIKECRRVSYYVSYFKTTIYTPSDIVKPTRVVGKVRRKFAPTRAIPR